MNQEKEIIIKENLWENIKKSKKRHIHIIMIATKPDIIKQAPIYLELKKRWESTILIHTWQHYDYNLSMWVLEEFWMDVDINLNIFWELHKKYSLIIERLWDIFKKLYDKYNKIPVPYVHWDTLTATTADKAAFLNKFAVVHVEAWIRTFTPNKKFYYKLFNEFKKWKFNWDKYYSSLQKLSIYERGSIEPYPEQFDTRWVEPSAWFYAVPVKLYEKTLLDEWFLKDNIKVVWNTIVDAIKISKKKIKDSKAFARFPNMKNKPFIFITIHRRENTENKERFLAIYNAIKKLIKDWVYVCFLWLYASESAIDRFFLRKDIDSLKEKYNKNFAYGEALAHHSEVIDMISKAWAVVTDSGSMQEEANIVWVPCVTIRFGSDRTETLLNWSNIIAPPINSKLIVKIIKWAIDNKKMRKKNIYWNNVSKKIINWVIKKLKDNWNLFRFDDERLELKRFFDFKI